jgi:hypothetical protein
MTAGVFGNAFSAAAAGETLGATTQAAQLGSMALGAQPSILTPEQEASVRGVVGERGFSEGVGRTIADMALTPALGPVGAPLAMEALRGVNQAEQEGKPIYHSVSDTIKSGQHILSYTPQSQIGQAEQNVLRAYIIGKGVAVAFGGLVGLGVGSLAVGRWARNRLSGVAPEGVKEITQGASQAVRELFTTGEIPTGKIRELELAAAANNTSVNHEVNEAILKHTPAVVINPKTTKLTITMNNGQIADEGTFPKALKDAIEATAKGEPPPLQFGESAALREIASIEGPQNKVNAIFEQFGMGIRVVDGRAAKGLRVTRVGKEFSVIGADFKKRFTTAKEVRQFVNDYPLSSNRIEDAAYKDLLVQGKNGFYLTAEVVNHDAMVGNLSVTPNWQTVLQYFTSSLQPQTVRLKDVEARLGAPLHTRVVIPMERAYTEFRAFNQPYQDEITQLVKGIGKHGPGSKREGYVHLMAEEPGSSGWNDLIREYKLDPQKAEQFRSLFLRGSEEFGIDGNKLLTQIIPRVRETGSLEKAFPSGHLPKEAAFWADDVNFGNVPFAEGTEHDIEVLARSFFSQGGFTIKAGKAWREAVQIADELMTQPLPANARSSWETLAMQRQQQHTYLEHYLRSVKGWGDHSDEMAMRWLGVTMQKLSVGSDIPPHQVTQLGKKVYGAMYASNYAAHFGFRLSAIGKQWLQLVQSTYPHFGGPETTRAINSLFGKGGQAQRQRIAEAGALLDTPIMTEADAGPMADWLQWSGKGLSWADNFNRLVPGSAQLNLMRRYLPGYQAKAPKVAPRGVMPAQAMPPPIGPPAPPPFTGPMMPPGIRAGGVAMRPIQRAPAAKPPPTITNTHAMPKNYGTVSPTFQKQFPMGTEVTFEAAEAGGLRPVKGTVTGYIRTKSGAEHATVAEPGVPNGHVANVAMGLKRAGGPGAKPGPKGPGLRQRVMMLKEQREAEGFVESIRTEVPYSKKPLAIQAMEDADMQPVMIPNRTPPPPPEVPIAPDIPEPPGIFSPLWKQFAADTKIDHFNWQEQQQIKTLIDNGETEEAINVAIRKSVAKTQYLYDMPNRPPALHSVAGRFVGQYATFPLSYIQQFRDIFTGGTRTNAQRIAHATRWFAANALVKGSAAAILGAEMGNYVFFQPMIVSGGPRFNWWLEVPKIMTGFSHQSMLGHVEKALEGNIPGAGMGKDIYRMMTAQDLAGVGRAVLNVPPTKEEKKRLGGR